MSRPLRIEFSGALYHIISRGNRQEDIYDDDWDRLSFLSLLEELHADYNWVCHSYCLMNNHYHFLIETPDANLSKGMRHINGVYTQRYNRRHERVGHLFQGRYKAILVEKENYLLELSRYIVLNPVRAGLVRAPEDWPWSSYRATVGQSPSPSYFNAAWLLATFGTTLSLAIERYKAFVAEGKIQAAARPDVRHQVYFGSEQFVEEMQLKIDGSKSLSEVPSTQRRPQPKALSYYEASASCRNMAIVEAYAGGGYTLKELGCYFGLHYSTISGIIRNHKSNG